MDTIEEGSVQFVAHPEHGHRETRFEETDHFFMVMSPDGKEHRLIELGRKRTPEMELGRASTAHHLWGVVRLLADERQKIRRLLNMKYGPDVRGLAAGKYLVNDHGNHSDLVFTLDIPEAVAGDAAHAGIDADGELILCIQNPETEIPKDFPFTGGRPGYPEAFRDMFDGSRFIKLENTALLDYENAAFVLMTPNPRLVHAEFKFFIDEDQENASASEGLDYLRQKKTAEPTKPLF